MSLYTIPQEVSDLLDKYYECFNEETGEQVVSDEEIQEISNKLEELKNKTGDLLEWYLKERANRLARIEMYKNEIERLKNLLGTEENKQEHLEFKIKRAFDAIYDGKPLSICVFKLSYRKSEAVTILDESKVPSEYKKEKTTISVDKTAIKESIKNGNPVDGAEMETRSNLTIK